MGTAADNPHLQWYMRRIAATPPLAEGQEEMLAACVHRNGEPRARRKIIRANLRLVVHIAREHAGAEASLADLIAEGNLALIQAVDTFNPHAGAPFRKYAAWCVGIAVRRVAADNARVVPVPKQTLTWIARWRQAAGALRDHLSRDPTPEEIIEALGIGRMRARTILAALAVTRVLRLADLPDIPPAVAGSPADEQHLSDSSQGPKTPPAVVQSLLGRLRQRERMVLELRFGIGHGRPRPLTVKEISRIFAVTPARVWQLQRQALERLRQCARREGLDILEEA